jgi:hypothetical protein
MKQHKPSPLLPFLLNREIIAFNPDDGTSTPTAYFMSYEWFNVTRLHHFNDRWIEHFGPQKDLYEL